MTEQSALFLGVDIGGTKVAAGVVNEKGEILHRTKVAMQTHGTAEDALAGVLEAIDGELAGVSGKIEAIGVSSPGPLDPKQGLIINPPNIPCWRNFNLVEALRNRFHLPVWLDNDSNAAGLAEALWGAGRGYRNVFYVTLGTGIGTGIIFDGEVYQGRTGAAGEGGHVTIDYRGPLCACGKRGCIEAFASGTAIARLGRKAVLEVGHEHAAHLLALAGGDPDKITGCMVAQACREGDELAGEVLRQLTGPLSVWLGSVVDMLEPDVIVFGGGVSELVSGWFGDISRKLPAWSVNQRCTEIPLLPALYGVESGIAGGAALCRSSSRRHKTATQAS